MGVKEEALWLPLLQSTLRPEPPRIRHQVLGESKDTLDIERLKFRVLSRKFGTHLDTQVALARHLMFSALKAAAAWLSLRPPLCFFVRRSGNIVPMRKPTFVASALVMAVLWPHVVASECVELARKPIKVSGALCGTVFDGITGELIIDGAAVRVVDDEHLNWTAAAEVESDSNGHFKFGALPKGKYWLGVAGFNGSYPIIQVTKANSSSCGRPLFLYVRVAGECRSEVTTKRKPRY
jgi:hypothetical protein